MKINQENIDELLRIGFRKSPLLSMAGGEFWTLSDGWSFEINDVNSFYHLKNKIKKSVNEDNFGEWTPETRSAYFKLARKYPDPIKGATQTKKQKLARVLTQAKKKVGTQRDLSDRLNEIHSNQIAIMEFLLDS